MTKECIKSAATIEEATAAALTELGLTDEDDYHVEVLKLPSKKILGLFGGSPAEVKVTVELPDAPAEKKAPRPEKKKKPAEKPQKKETAEKPKAAKPAEKAEKGDKAESAKAPAEKPLSFSERKARLTPTDAHEKTAAYIAELVRGLGLPECEVEAFENDEEILFELSCGEDYGIVIGRRGETLDAIQYLARMVENRGRQGYKRVGINIGDYREKREAALADLAKKDAARVLRTGRSLTLEPMNPYERRIIHTTIQEIDGVTSYSTGVDLDRRVIIASENAPKGGARSGRSGDYRHDRNDRRDRRDRSDRPRREPYVPDVAADREKRNDVAGASLYGKIEVKKEQAAPDSTEAE